MVKKQPEHTEKEGEGIEDKLTKLKDITCARMICVKNLMVRKDP